MQQHRAECLLWGFEAPPDIASGSQLSQSRNPLLCLQPYKAHLFCLSNLSRRLGLNFLQSPGHAVLKILRVAALACKLSTPNVCIMHCNLPTREYRVYDMFENVQDLMFSSSCHRCNEEASIWTIYIVWMSVHCSNCSPHSFCKVMQNLTSLHLVCNNAIC